MECEIQFNCFKSCHVGYDVIFLEQSLCLKAFIIFKFKSKSLERNLEITTMNLCHRIWQKDVTCISNLFSLSIVIKILNKLRLNYSRADLPNSLTHGTEWCIHVSVQRANIGSDNGLSPVRRQAIIWINAGILSIGQLGTSFSEFFIEMEIFSFKKM